MRIFPLPAVGAEQEFRAAAQRSSGGADRAPSLPARVVRAVGSQSPSPPGSAISPVGSPPLASHRPGALEASAVDILSCRDASTAESVPEELSGSDGSLWDSPHAAEVCV